MDDERVSPESDLGEDAKMETKIVSKPAMFLTGGETSKARISAA